MSARAISRWPQMIGMAVVLGLVAFVIFGPLANLFLWAFAEKWYFPNKIPQEFGFTFWARVFSPRGNALESLVSAWYEATSGVEPGSDPRHRAPSAA